MIKYCITSTELKISNIWLILSLCDPLRCVFGCPHTIFLMINVNQPSAICNSAKSTSGIRWQDQSCDENTHLHDPKGMKYIKPKQLKQS